MIGCLLGFVFGPDSISHTLPDEFYRYTWTRTEIHSNRFAFLFNCPACVDFCLEHSFSAESCNDLLRAPHYSMSSWLKAGTSSCSQVFYQWRAALLALPAAWPCLSVCWPPPLPVPSGWLGAQLRALAWDAHLPLLPPLPLAESSRSRFILILLTGSPNLFLCSFVRRAFHGHRLRPLLWGLCGREPQCQTLSAIILFELETS